jgi:5-methylcytosine-specific restriction endonuclease McrA
MRGVSSWAKECYERDNWHCRSCNRTQSLQPHHIKFRSHGGTDTLDNLLTLCWQCHRAVHDGFLKITIDSDLGTIHFERLKGFKI